MKQSISMNKALATCRPRLGASLDGASQQNLHIWKPGAEVTFSKCKTNDYWSNSTQRFLQGRPPRKWSNICWTSACEELVNKSGQSAQEI